MLHCFSVDLEGFCEGMAESIPVPPELLGGVAERREIEANVAQVLDWLEGEGVRGTFFVLGRIAEQQPHLIRDIVRAGHELGSHSHDHLRLYRLDKKEARRQIERSKKVLEDVSGQQVLGFRAPDFSITGQNLDLLDALAEAGYQYDSSINPASLHDVYGVPGSRRTIHTLPSGLVEFPPATCQVMKQVVPVLGGGYFRLAPLWLSWWVAEHFERVGRPIMSYIHPYEIASVYPVLDGLPPLKRARHYVNLDQSRRRYTSLFKRFQFGTARDVLLDQGFELDIAA